jgi:hypothetical protein
VNNGRRNLGRIPSPHTQGEVIATFSEYRDAVVYVEKLMTADFPPGSIAIVGNNLRSVERVRGRISNARVALSGASTGLTIGLLVGLISPVSTTSADVVAVTLGALIQPMLIGAGVGMLFNILRFSLAKNKRSFASVSMAVAKDYEVQVPGNLVEQAKRVAAGEEPKSS